MKIKIGGPASGPATGDDEPFSTLSPIGLDGDRYPLFLQRKVLELVRDPGSSARILDAHDQIITWWQTSPHTMT
jgi:hypothetical protein